MKQDKMTEEEIRDHVSRAIEQSYLYIQGEAARDNDVALAFFNGDVSSQIEDEEGRSKAVSKDVADTITWIIPQLMRVFMMSDSVAQFLAKNPGHVDAAQDASEYVNQVFIEDCDGYRKLHDAIFDGLLTRVGIAKLWWDDTPEYDTALYTGLSQAMAQMIAAHEDVEVLEYSEAEPELKEYPDPNTGRIVQVPEPRFEMKIKRLVSTGRAMCSVVPPEDFLIDRAATCLEDARLLADRARVTRGDLVEEGYDRDLVAEIPSHTMLYSQEEQAVRREGVSDLGMDSLTEDWAAEEVEKVEAFIKLDVNGDGKAEWMRVCMGGIGAGSVLLHMEEWDDDSPYYACRPEPVPHRWQGRSVADNTMDIQAQKTVVLRALLDNTYQHTNPTPAYDYSVVRDDEAIEALTVIDGSPVPVRGNPASAIFWYQVPYVGDKALATLEYLDQVREMRTGMSRAAMGMSGDVLQNQTAYAVQQSTSASMAKVEQYARNIAETFMKPLMKGLYRLITQHQDRPRTIRLSETDFRDVDPRPWPSEMDVQVNVGLGTGSRDRDVAALTALGAYQQNVLQIFGPNNPIVRMQEVRELGKMMCETQGLRNHERLVAGDDQMIEQWQQQQAEAAQQNGAMAEAQMKMQIEMAKIQAKAQAEAASLQQKGQLATAERAQDAQQTREEQAQDIALEREKTASELALERWKFGQEMALEREQMHEEIDVKERIARYQAQNRPQTVRVGGEPG